MTIPVRTAMEALSVADALQTVAVQVGRLERAGYPEVAGSPEAAVLRTNARLVSDALLAIAARLAARPAPV
jgi:hypothetical protein